MALSHHERVISAVVLFLFQAEDGIRDSGVTGVQTCALPICGFGSSEPGYGHPTSRGKLRCRPAGRPSLRYHPQVIGTGRSGSEPVSDYRNGIEWRASLPSLPPLQRILLTMINAVGDADDYQRHAAVGGASRIETRELRGGEEAEWDRF